MLLALRADLRMHEEYTPLPRAIVCPGAGWGAGGRHGRPRGQDRAQYRAERLGGRGGAGAPAVETPAPRNAARETREVDTPDAVAQSELAPDADGTAEGADAVSVSLVVDEEFKAKAMMQSIAPSELKLFDGEHFYIFDDSGMGAQAGSEPRQLQTC